MKFMVILKLARGLMKSFLMILVHLIQPQKLALIIFLTFLILLIYNIHFQEVPLQARAQHPPQVCESVSVFDVFSSNVLLFLFRAQTPDMRKMQHPPCENLFFQGARSRRRRQEDEEFETENTH